MSNQGGIQAQFHECANVGKRIKKSKKRYTWQFSIDGRSQKLDLYVSSLSGKRKVMLNGEIRFNGKKAGGVQFNHTFNLGNHLLSLIQFEGGYDLRIDNKSFQHLQGRQGMGEWGNSNDISSQRSSGVDSRPTNFNNDWGEPERRNEPGMNDRQLRDLAVLADWDENYEDTPAYKPQAKFEAPKPRKPSPTPPRREEPVKLSPPRNTIGAKPEIPPPTTSSNEMDLMSGITQGATKKVDVFGFDIAEPEQPTGETDLFGLAPLKPAANPSANPYATAPQAFIPPATSVNPFENPQMQPMNPAMQQQIAANQMMYNQFMTNMMMQQGMMTNPQNMNFQPPK